VAKLLGRLAKDPRVPAREKALLTAFLAYLASPLDLIPDWLPGIGHLDDWLFAALVLDRIVAATGEEVIKEAWDGQWDILKVVRTIRGAMPAALARRLLSLLGQGWKHTRGSGSAVWRRSALLLRRLLRA